MQLSQYIFRITALCCCLASFSVNAELVAIVSAHADVGAISKSDLANIYLGKNVSSAPSLSPIDQKAGPTRAHFYEVLLGKTIPEMSAYWSREVFTGHAYPPREEAGDAGVKAAVSENPSYIGYVNSNVVDGSVKIVTHID